MPKRQQLKPWWLEQGTEVCPICSHLYPYQTEYRCSDCDGAVCPNCIDLETMTCIPCSDSDGISIDIELEVL